MMDNSKEIRCSSATAESEIRKYYLLGQTLAHSLSADIYGKLGLDYSLKELADKNAVAEFLARKDFAGLNVTIPYKETVMHYLDYIDKTALDIGAVNIVLNVEGRLLGYNTDFCGMAKALLRAEIMMQGNRIMILGSGGTARTAQHLAVSSNAGEVAIVSRSSALNCKDFEPDIIINATPVGMFPNAGKKPVELKDFKNVHAVFDAIYNPIKTRLVQDARSIGLKYSGGLAMLAEQARLAYELFTGYKSDKELFSQIYFGCLRKQCNIVLIGMAGAGKTSIGRRLSAIDGRPFFDTDEIIERKTGMNIPQIFKIYGESTFRDFESAVVREIAAENGAIIATGGGALLDEENRYLLGANAIGVHIRRDLRLLDVTGRPLYQVQDVGSLWERRHHIYEGFCDFEINNCGEIEDAATSILNRITKLI
jgi:shikimate dehydrogenase